MVEIKINSEYIKLDAFLKWANITSSGSDAKFFIRNGEVKVNDEIEVRRGKKLYTGDIIEFESEKYKIID